MIEGYEDWTADEIAEWVHVARWMEYEAASRGLWDFGWLTEIGVSPISNPWV